MRSSTRQSLPDVDHVSARAGREPHAGGGKVAETSPTGVTLI